MGVWPEREIGNPALITPFSSVSLGALNAQFVSSIISANPFFTWPTANKAMFYPFVIRDRPWTVKTAMLFNGTTVSGTVDIGVYDSRGNRIVSTGATAQSGTSVVQLIDLTDTTLQPGEYYMALSISNTTAHVYLVIGAPNQAMGFANCWVMASAHPLPSTVTLAAFDVAQVPVFGLSALTV